MGCELAIPLSKTELNECLTKIWKGHPLIHKSVSINDQNEALLIDTTTPYFDITEFDNQQYETIAVRLLKDRWNLDRPLIKFTINHNNPGCQLIISGNHAICDGLSLVYLMEDIAGYLQGGLIPEEQVPISLHPSEMRKKQAAWPFKLLAFVLGKKWKRHSFKLTQNLLSDIYKAYWKDHDARIMTLDFDESKTEKIISSAKASGVTVNTLLTYLLYKSQLSVSSKPFRDDILISVNLRDKIKTNPKRQLGYFVTAVRINLSKFQKIKPDSLKRLQDVIKGKLSAPSLFRSLAMYYFDPVFFDLVQLNKFQLRQDKSVQKMASKLNSGIKNAFALTNLGVLKPNPICDRTLTRFLPLALVSDTMEKYISVFTQHSKMQVSICYDPILVPDKDIEKFKFQLLEELFPHDK